MGSFGPTLIACSLYVLTVKWWGPGFMRDRPAYQLRRTLVVYNAAQVAFSAYLFYESLMGGWLGHYSFRCQPVDYSDNPLANRVYIEQNDDDDYSPITTIGR